MPESTRLFFGNPGKTTGMKPMPKGDRNHAFGEAQLEPAKQPVMDPLGSQHLAFGNRSVNPMPDTPFQVVDGKPMWVEPPK